MVPLIVPNVFPLVAWVIYTSLSHHSSKVCYTVYSTPGVPAVYTYFSLDSGHNIIVFNTVYAYFDT